MSAKWGVSPQARQQGLGAATGIIVALMASVAALAALGLLVWAVWP